LYVVAADVPVAMDTDDIHTAVTTESSDLSSQAVTSTAGMACTLPDTAGVCLLASVPKVTLDDDGLDLAEPFSLGTYSIYS